MLSKIFASIIDKKPKDLASHLSARRLTTEEAQEAFLVTLIANDATSAEILLAQGVDIEAMDRNGNTLLCSAIAGIRHEHVKLLLQKGANVSNCDSGGYAPLHHVAIVASNLSGADEVKTALLREILWSLLKNGADIHQKSVVGNSPVELSDLLEVEWLKKEFSDWESKSKESD